MTKYLTATLVALAVSASAFAGTFVVPPNATITGSPDGTVSWSGVKLGSIVHYRDTNATPPETSVGGASSGSIQLKEIASYGGRLQLRDSNGNYAWLSPAGARFNLVGIHVDCSNHDGCALEISGASSKSGPVPSYAGGVYQGYAPTQLSTGAVVTPVTMVQSPTMAGASQSTGKYKLVPVMTEAEKAGMKKPAPKAKAKVPAVAKAAPTKDCGGLPQSVGGQLVQKPCEPIYLGVPTPQVIAPTAPATPPAATAPAAPAAAKKQS